MACVVYSRVRGHIGLALLLVEEEHPRALLLAALLLRLAVEALLWHGCVWKGGNVVVDSETRRNARTRVELDDLAALFQLPDAEARRSPTKAPPAHLQCKPSSLSPSP